MPRPPLPLGSWGKITRTQLDDNRWRARTRFRDMDGRTRDVTAVGPTAAKAERKLITELTARSAAMSADITRDTRLESLTKTWLTEVIDAGELKPQTIERYTGICNHDIIPALGGLTLREVSVSIVDRHLKSVAAQRPAQAASVKQVLSQIMALAVRHDALEYNPVKSVGRLRTVKKEIRALGEEDLARVRAGLAAWRTGVDEHGRQPLGPRPDGRVPDVIDLLLATGARINEVLALRWSDIDLESSPATVTIAGTLVSLKGIGIVRQDSPKTESSRRTLTIPSFAVEMLTRRREQLGTNDLDAVFVTRNGTWVSAHNIRRAWRDIRSQAGLEWVVLHTFRKTVATMIEREFGATRAAGQLGHSNEAITTGFYVEKNKVTADSSVLLERLAPTHK